MAILDTAVDAEASVEKLATEMGEAGFDPETIKIVQQMAEVARKIVKALGEGAEAAPASNPDEAAQAAEAEAAAADAEQPGTISEATDQMIANRKG